MTSKPSLALNHDGPLPLRTSSSFAAWARLVPSANQSSPLPPTADSVSWLSDIPVLAQYPHAFRPSCAPASSLCNLNESAPRAALEGANPISQLINIFPRSEIWWAKEAAYNQRPKIRLQTHSRIGTALGSNPRDVYSLGLSSHFSTDNKPYTDR